MIVLFFFFFLLLSVATKRGAATFSLLATVDIVPTAIRAVSSLAGCPSSVASVSVSSSSLCRFRFCFCHGRRCGRHG